MTTCKLAKWRLERQLALANQRWIGSECARMNNDERDRNISDSVSWASRVGFPVADRCDGEGQEAWRRGLLEARADSLCRDCRGDSLRGSGATRSHSLSGDLRRADWRASAD